MDNRLCDRTENIIIITIIIIQSMESLSTLLMDGSNAMLQFSLSVYRLNEPTALT